MASDERIGAVRWKKLLRFEELVQSSRLIDVLICRVSQDERSEVINEQFFSECELKFDNVSSVWSKSDEKLARCVT